jgi:hypothetical protein
VCRIPAQPMNRRRILGMLLGIYLAGAGTAQARLRESPAQCDLRYGAPLFQNVSGDLEYCSYSFSGRNVTVGFYKSASLIETFDSGRGADLSDEQRARMEAKMMAFFRGLLATAYGFTEGQLQGLDKLQRAAGISRATVMNGDVSATYLIQTAPDQKSCTISGSVSEPKAIAAAKNMSFFLAESAGLAFKHRKAEKAKGL